MMANYKVIKMKSFTKMAIFTIALFALAACESEKSEDETVNDVSVAVLPEADLGHKSQDPDLGGAMVTPGSPFRVTYTIIGTPVVGSPVTVDLQIESVTQSQPVNLEYRIRDASSMMLADSQPARVRMEPAANENVFKQQVTVIPQREGRFYLNVSASFETKEGTRSTVTAIPLQVGSGTRELQENGEVQVDENGEAVKVLTSE
jgi:hypothetical protein